MKAMKSIAEFELVRKGSGKLLNVPTGAHILATDELAAWICQSLPDNGRESLFAVALNTTGEIVGASILSVGSVDCCLLYARDIYSWALHVPSVRYVGLAHNHPSGNTKPSKPDYAGTKSIAAAGKLLGLPLVWSLVVSHQSSETWGNALLVPPPETEGDDAEPQRPDREEPEDEEPGEPGKPGEPEPESEPGPEPGEEAESGEPGEEAESGEPGESGFKNLEPKADVTRQELVEALRQVVGGNS